MLNFECRMNQSCQPPLVVDSGGISPASSASISWMVGRLDRSSSGKDSVSWVCQAATAMDWSRPRRTYSATSLLEEVGVFEKLGGHVGVRRRHGEGEVVLCLARAEMELALDVQLKDAATPAVGEGLADVKVAGGWVFDHLEQTPASARSWPPTPSSSRPTGRPGKSSSPGNRKPHGEPESSTALPPISRKPSRT
jgi:hypothetical protein